MHEGRGLRESALFSVYRDDCLLVARNGRRLLKNSIAEFYEEEKYQKSPSYETYSQ